MLAAPCISMTQSPRKWYAVYTKPQKEDYAQLHLQSKGLETYCPRLWLPEASKKRKRKIPLFPNYLFVRFYLLSDEYNYAAWSPGVRRIVSFNGVPATIDDGIISFLMQQANATGLIVARSNLTAGQEVRLTGGPFDGLAGIIQEPPNARGRIKMLLKLLSRTTKVEVPIRFVKGEWVPSDSESISDRVSASL
jgi:transcriptional antiterminator RfaH